MLMTEYRMKFTMEKMEKMSESEQSIFMRVLFGLSTPSPVPADLSSDEEFGKIEWVDQTLNESQKDAIRFALASKEIALIHGPPGVSSGSLLVSSTGPC
jgi:DNA polymerase alpha-associated DNA helicase A